MSDLLVLFIHFYEGVSSDFGASAEGVMMLPSGPFVAGGCGAMIGACSTGLGADELASKMTAELPRPCERLNLLFLCCRTKATPPATTAAMTPTAMTT